MIFSLEKILSITALRKKTLITTLSITTLRKMDESVTLDITSVYHYAECRYAECRGAQKEYCWRNFNFVKWVLSDYPLSVPKSFLLVIFYRDVVSWCVCHFHPNLKFMSKASSSYPYSGSF
jgi:hypothetical protein